MPSFLHQRGLGVCGVLIGLVAPSVLAEDVSKPPNILLIMADDLGYGDLGCYGQKKIGTPNLDRMASQGLRFTRFYSGSPVCAPARCVLMTGLHTGHARIRGNADPTTASLLSRDVTVAQVLKQAGYATAVIGKWGLGDESTGGLPNDHGFDHFFGYLNHVHAHNYYPRFLWRNREKVPLRNVVRDAGKAYGGFTGGVAMQKIDYSHDLFVADALTWMEKNKDGPFFLYLALTIPHANNEARRSGMEVPALGEYADMDWPDPEKGKAAMISRMDRDVGRMLEKLRELGIDRRTIVLFTSDNGPHKEGGVDPEFLDSNGPLRGIKRHLYEGGIRVPLIAWQPGTIPAGGTADEPAYFGDFFATAAALAGVQPPGGLDSASFAHRLGGAKVTQPARELYWEFYEGGGARALIEGRWKAVRPKWHAPIELYDLSSDEAEQHDLARQHPQIVERLGLRMDQARVADEHWPAPNAMH